MQPNTQERPVLTLDRLSAPDTLPTDHQQATLVGRVWVADEQPPGPHIVKFENGNLIDITDTFPTMRDLLGAQPDPATAVKKATGPRLGKLSDILAQSPSHLRKGNTHLLSPIDTQVVKASGITFATAFIERVLTTLHPKDGEDPAKFEERKEAIRKKIARYKEEGRKIVPGSADAEELAKELVAIGANPEYVKAATHEIAAIFSKAQTLSTLGHGADAGFLPPANDDGFVLKSLMSNPEPEVVAVIAPHNAVGKPGKIVGVTLGNDVNMQDIENCGTLFRNSCKDGGNAGCTLGPFIRLFDEHFSMKDVREMEVKMTIEGQDGFRYDGTSSMKEITRDPEALVHQMTMQHQYPDGAVLFCGTMCPPPEIRFDKKATHKRGDIVTISTPKLGTLTNIMLPTPEIEPWTYGIGEFTDYRVQRAAQQSRPPKHYVRY